MNLINESQVFETWSPILEEKTGISDSSKLKWMSKYAHYHSLNEGFTYPQASLFNTPGMGNVAPATTVAGGASTFYGSGSKGSGDKFPSLLPLAIQVAARTVGFDIVSVVPMNGPSGVLTYLDYVYAGGRDAQMPGIPSSSSAGGAANSFKDKALVFKLNTATFTSTVFTTAIPPAAGTVYAVVRDSDAASITAGTTPVLIVAYVGKSRIDGFPIFRVLGEVSSGTITGSAGGTVTANIANGDTQSVSFATVIDGTNQTYFFAVASYNQATGAFGAITQSASDSVNGSGKTGYYVELVKALEDHIFGFSGAGPNDTDAYQGDGTDGTVPYEPMRRGVGETSYYRTMGLTAFTKFVEAETFQVAATVTTEQIQDLNRQYGIDVVSMMENALVNEISQSINKHILSRAFALGWQNAYDFALTEGVNLNLSLNPASTSISDAPTYGASFIGKTNQSLTISLPTYAIYGGSTAAFENQGTIQRRIQSKVLAAANVVAQRGRRGPGNFVVTNLQIATALQDSAQFTFYPLANTVNQNNGALYPLGTLAGMTIYVDPNMKYGDTRVLVGRKGADEEPGLKFMPYLMAESIQTIAEGTMAPKIAVKSRYALVEAGFHPQTQYFTFLVNLRATTSSAKWNSTADTLTIA
jgi:hypothetical protein